MEGRSNFGVMDRVIVTPAPTVHRITVDDGVALQSYVWEGTGVPIVLVHGLASNALLWQGVAANLAAAGHPVTAIDQRGHGRSDRPDWGYDYERVTADLVEVISHVGYDRPVVAGQSWGGNVAVQFAARHGDRLRAMVAVDGGTIDLSKNFDSWEACKEALTPPSFDGTPIDKMEAGSRARHPDWPESGIQGALACFDVDADGRAGPALSLANHLQILDAMWTDPPTARYPDVAVPSLIISAHGGDLDSPRAQNKRAAVDAACAAIAGPCRAEWIEGDHDLHAQFPEHIATLIAEMAV